MGLGSENNINLILFKTKNVNMSIETYFREVQIDPGKWTLEREWKT